MVNTVLKSIRILDLLAGTPNMGLSEIVRALELPKSSVYGLLETLAAEQLVERNEDTGRYHLGVRLVEFGNRPSGAGHLDCGAVPAGLNVEFDETALIDGP
jgi:DNA-binding IclR family transcriptional regulator